MKPIDIKALREAIAGTTSLPWRYGAIEHGGRCLVDARGYVFASVDDDGNGRFAAVASAALPEALDRVEALEREVTRLHGDEATMKLAGMLGLGDPVRPDVHAKVTRQRDDARAALVDMTIERDAYRAMICDLLASVHPHPKEHPTMTKQWDRARDLLKNGPALSGKGGV